MARQLTLLLLFTGDMSSMNAYSPAAANLIFASVTVGWWSLRLLRRDEERLSLQ